MASLSHAIDQQAKKAVLPIERQHAVQANAGYHQALAAYSSKNYRLAADKVSRFLTDDPESELRFQAYRLWIEALAEVSDRGGLVELSRHLSVRGEAEAEDHITYFALRGLIYFELDQHNAARVFSDAVIPELANPYALELVALVSRDAEKLLASTVPVTDFVLWQTVYRQLLSANDEQGVSKVVALLSKSFPETGFEANHQFHLAYERKEYQAALKLAEVLTKKHPESYEFQYYKGLISYHLGSWKKSVEALQAAYRLGGSKDPDVVSLLAEAQTKLGIDAKPMLVQAVKLLKAHGLPTTHLQFQLAPLLKAERAKTVKAMPRLPRNWLVTLSPRRYFDLATDPTAEISQLARSVHREAMPGDIVFFAGVADQGEGKQWKLIAVYGIESAPTWDPMAGYQSPLKLKIRLSEGVPLDIAVEGSPRRGKDAEGYGIFELDSAALDIIEASIKLSREDMIERRRDGGLTRRPTA